MLGGGGRPGRRRSRSRGCTPRPPPAPPRCAASRAPPPPPRPARSPAPPPLAPSAVQDDLDLLILGEIPPQMIPQARLVSGDDEQASNRAAPGRDSGPPPGACQAARRAR